MHHKANAKTLFLKGVARVQPKNFQFNLSGLPDKKIVLLGSGKAVVEMARQFQKEDIQIRQSFLVSNYAASLPGLELFVSSHPSPSSKSVEAGQKMLGIVSALHEEDYFVYLLSGGSSALLEKPIPPVTLKELQQTTRLLLSCGASIYEINIVRKHLSLIKGGQLGQISKSEGCVYVVSDVIGDDLEVIGSAPFYCDSSNCADAKAVLIKYDLWSDLPISIQNVIKFCHHETPEKPNPKIKHEIIASNRIALEAIVKEAEKMGYNVKLVSDKIKGDVRSVAEEIVQKAREIESDKPLCLLFGGESTVKVRGKGKGGRNQELALWVLKSFDQGENFTFLSGGTDGIDGMGDAAGAVVSQSDLHEDIDVYLQHNDSWHYHQKYGTAIVTGETGTNVMDIMILIKD